LPKPVSRTDVSPVSTGSWVDIDVSAHVLAGHTRGVILEIVNSSPGTSYEWGVRKNGSSDTYLDDVYYGSHTYACIGVDSSCVFEARIEHADVEIYLVGYLTDREATFKTNAVLHTIGAATGAWTDVDISGDTGAETALFAFLLCWQNSGAMDWGLRRNGSTDNRYASMYDGYLYGAMVAVDGSEIFEAYQTVAGLKLYLVGWLWDNVSAWANMKAYATGTTGAWVDTDLSGDIPAGNTGAFMAFEPLIHNVYAAGIRKDGDAYDNYLDIVELQSLWLEISAARVVEQKIENAWQDLWLSGYTGEADETYPPAPGNLGLIAATPAMMGL